MTKFYLSQKYRNTHTQTNTHRYTYTTTAALLVGFYSFINMLPGAVSLT